jgi:predicted N-formylglutamate amidohydrolase
MDRPTQNLLQPGDPAPFEIVNGGGKAPIILFADHAGLAFPKLLGPLGLKQEALGLHIAWDIGIADLARKLAPVLDAPAILGCYSRLVIDNNRRLSDPTSIPQESDRVPVPGNRGLTPQDRDMRAAAIFAPYHAALDGLIQAKREQGQTPWMVSLHSFTPVMNGFVRPWHVGVLWHRDPTLPVPLMARLAKEPDLCVGDNEPYSGRDEHGYSIIAHGEKPGLPHVLFEIRQDLISDPAGVARWTDILARALSDVFSDLAARAPEREKAP